MHTNTNDFHVVEAERKRKRKVKNILCAERKCQRTDLFRMRARVSNDKIRSAYYQFSHLFLIQPHRTCVTFHRNEKCGKLTNSDVGVLSVYSRCALRRTFHWFDGRILSEVCLGNICAATVLKLEIIKIRRFSQRHTIQLIFSSLNSLHHLYAKSWKMSLSFLSEKFVIQSLRVH